MKKILKIMLMSITIVLLSLIMVNYVFASEYVTVKLNGETLYFDVPAQVIYGRTMVPMRKILESLGATVYWDDATQTVTSVKNDTSISLTLGIPSIIINGEEVLLDAAPCLVDGRTLVPVRAISEAFNMKVDWDEFTQTVFISNIVDTPYERLKNFIINEGIEEKSGMYEYADTEFSTGFSAIYNANKDFLILTAEDEISYFGAFISNDEYPYFVTEITQDYGDDIVTTSSYTIFSKPPQSIEEFKLGFSESNYGDSLYSLVNIKLNIIDLMLSHLIGLTLSDFGIYYEPVE